MDDVLDLSMVGAAELLSIEGDSDPLVHKPPLTPAATVPAGLRAER